MPLSAPLLVLGAALILALPAAAAEPATPFTVSATCSAAQKTTHQKTLAAFRRSVPATRAAYFRTHKSAAARAVFAKRQQAKLKLLQAAAACSLPVPVPAAAALLPPLAPPNAAYQFGAGVSAADQATVKRVFARVFPYLVRDWAVPVDLPLTIVWDNDKEALARGYALQTGSSIEYSRALVNSTPAVATPTGTVVNASEVTASEEWGTARIVAHELFHVAQHAFAGRAAMMGGEPDVPGAGPRWFIEGSAELVGWSVAAAAGMPALPLEGANEEAGVRQASLPLRSSETLQGIKSDRFAYPVSHFALKYLMRGRPGPTLAAFWRQIAGGLTWQASFASTFGQTIDAFYTAFESYRP